MGDVHGVGGPSRRVLTVRAARTSALLSLLFVVVYGFTNWFTAQRPASDVRTWVIWSEVAWIPYVPVLIVPYMSLDLFFVAAPFLCREERERQVLTRRVVFSILTAAAFFLLIPLKLAWPPRPRLPGLFGDYVEVSCTLPFLMEFPHNLFPSLHITLSGILAEFYGRHTRGIVRGLLQAWFGLVSFSTVLTWQHHVIDIVGGFALAAFAIYFFRASSTRLRGGTNVRVGSCYAAGATLVLTLALLWLPWGTFLIWPAAALGIVAAGYFGLGPGVYRKTGGRVPLSARFVLAPVLLGQYLSLAYYRRRCRACDVVAPGVLLGRTLTEAEASAAVQQGVTAVLDLTAELPAAEAFRAVRYRNLPLLDLTAPTHDQLDEAVAFIAAEAAQGTVYLHCKVGYSRSGTVAGAYLLASGEAATAEEAIERLRAARPSIVLRREAREALRQFARRAKADCHAARGQRVVKALTA
jgi:protein-tyrosine phosphatase/membrane-associated phospholipid phosphatase